ncbi:MAG TPA: hypothetical protein VJ809_16865 [Pirellulales bacterium]|jgi:hypothetical protein|nr:hypothetical protein [Pirellulales bacterium]
MSNADQRIKVLETIQGTSFVAIRSALVVLAPHKLDVTKYQIRVVREGDAEVVLFTEKKPDRPPAKSYGVRLAPDKELNLLETNKLVARLQLLKVMDQMDGSNYPPIPIAFALFEPRKPDLALYQIRVFGKGESVTVAFTDKDRQPGTRGGGGRLGFEAEMKAEGLKVLRSNFLK